MNINVLSVKQVLDRQVRYDVGDDNMTSPQAVARLVNSVLDLENDAQERLGMLSLDTKNKVVGIHVISTGTLNSSVVHPREVFKSAILNNANAIILFHNHPSGDTEPSRADVDVTERVFEAGELLGISLLDHVIVGYDGYTSLKLEGLM